MEYKDKILYYIDKLSLLREDYVKAFETIKAKYSYDDRDARVAVFTKCASTMNTAFIGFVLIRDELLRPLWWNEHIGMYDKNHCRRFRHFVGRSRIQADKVTLSLLPREKVH